MKDVIAADGDLAIRRMRDEAADYDLIAAWRSAPHVHEWWDPDEPSPDSAGAAAELRPYMQGSDPTVACIIEVEGRPAGFIQFYPWAGEADYISEVGITVPDGAWGLDLFIGETAFLHRGIGSRAVRLLSDHLFANLGATTVALATEATNTHAQAAYVRAGMRVVQEFLDTDRRAGRRVRSLLMIRERPGGTAAGR
jgi:RimJ/RimL family protein N-acetyltransferase